MPRLSNPSKIRDISFCNEENLEIYLKNRSFFNIEDQNYIKYFIDNYTDCWKIWNKVRWDASMNSVGVQELKEYLKEDFIPYYDSSWGLANEWINKKPQSDREITDFYKNTKNYVYNLVIWHESGDRDNYDKEIETLVTKYKINSAIDFGCGVGTDSLSFIQKGVETYSVDFNCPATDFLKWRFEKRQLKFKFLNIETLKLLPKSEMFWAIDVLEHVPDPMSVMRMIDFESCKVFAHCSRFNDTAGGRHPCHINFESKLISDFLLEKGFRNIEENGDLSVWLNLDLVNKHT